MMGKVIFSKENVAILKVQAAQKNEQYIQQQLQTLKDVKQNLQDFKQQLQASSNPKLQKQLEVRIRHQEQQLTAILGRLKNAGYTDKRGRPKKEVTDTYKANRIKFTAHLQKEQMDYVKQLQATGQIANVSAFLDELIAQHQKNNG
ncbi:hypothetical protein JTI58_12130 [Lysinibacillus fusiformis]|uniref:hypothetical protein n=1 Tax=Lysinibacillus fusiformis TaxID=28031 RepID=UPI0019675649|nr:hypothetical protein [Lysinibacillus fusiformis]QSB12305.1 hypothetical protein JTI58_12130 [Lysinibacillus fusiformis]